VDRFAIGIAKTMTYFTIDVCKRQRFNRMFVETYVIPRIRHHIREPTYDKVTWLVIPPSTKKFSLGTRPLTDAAAGIKYNPIAKQNTNNANINNNNANSMNDRHDEAVIPIGESLEENFEEPLITSEHGSVIDIFTVEDPEPVSQEPKISELTDEVLSAAKETASAQVSAGLLGINLVSVTANIVSLLIFVHYFAECKQIARQY
jgi:hypothetical protein